MEKVGKGADMRFVLCSLTSYLIEFKRRMRTRQHIFLHFIIRQLNGKDNRKLKRKLKLMDCLNILISYFFSIILEDILGDCCLHGFMSCHKHLHLSILIFPILIKSNKIPHEMDLSDTWGTYEHTHAFTRLKNTKEKSSRLFFLMLEWKLDPVDEPMRIEDSLSVVDHLDVCCGAMT